MSDNDFMDRGRSQVLYNYLPGKTFDYSGPYGIHRVKQVDAVNSTDVNADFIAERILTRVRQWRDSEDSLGAVGFPQNPDQYRLLEPQKVRSELFPLLFYCSECGLVETYDDPDELRTYNASLTCRHDGCDGELRQYRYVFIHECGEIETPDPYKCSDCGSFDQWRLDTQDSQRFENFRWHCQCGNTKSLYSRCDCSLSNNRMRLSVHSGSSVHIPHHFSLINIKEDAAGSASSPVYGKKVLARYLGLTDAPVDEMDLEQAGGGEEVEGLKTTLENLEQMYEESGGQGLKESIEKTKRQIAELEENTDPLVEVVNNHVSLTEVDSGPQSTLSETASSIVYELRQYLSTIEQFDRKPVREVILEAGASDPQSQRRREARADRIEQQLLNSGIARATFIEDFPITNVVFGYSRGSRDEDEAILKGFSENQVRASGEGFPVFVDTVATEATQLELNPRAVLAWLLDNSLGEGEAATALRTQLLASETPTDHGYPVLEDWADDTIRNWVAQSDVSSADTEPLSEWEESAIRAWIVDNMGQIPEYSSIDVDDEEKAVTYFVYHLVHTYSHSILKQITRLSGISRTSLAEHLLPYALSSIIYTDQREDFSLGGIYTLLESDLDDLLSEIHRQGNNCVYDPVCSRRGSACFSCMHISEVSCSHLNRNIARDFLFGSKAVAPRELTGYLELAGNFPPHESA